MPSAIRDHRDLDLIQRSLDLAVLIYQLTRTFPKEEQFGLTFQLRKAAVSVPSNIAEGYGRRTTPEYIKHLRIAGGSLREIETQLLLTVRLELTSEEDVQASLDLCDRIGRMLTMLIRSLRAKRTQ